MSSIGTILIVVLIVFEGAGNYCDAVKSIGNLEARLKTLSIDQKLGYLIKLSNLGTEDKTTLMEIVAKERAKRRYQRKLARCMAVFQSKQICDNTATFYVWARMAAQDVSVN